MKARYFAYGSNLHPARMRERVPQARALGAARLRGVRLVCNKLGRDGTAKANLEPASSVHVWSVLWALPASAWPELDEVEAGYQRVTVEVEHAGGALRAETYRSSRLTSEPVLHVDYKRFLVDGAREHGLPSDWVALLEQLPVR